jgi:large subunit ribosomal protein L18
MRGRAHKLAFKRRRAGSTDYALRTKLLRSKLPQLVVRSSNRYIYVQVTNPMTSGDRVLTSASSKELVGFGWNLGSASIPAAYLVGYLAGLRAVGQGISSAILNMGLTTPTRGNKAFAVVGGAAEAGLKVPKEEAIFPPQDRLYGRHIADYIEKVREIAKQEEGAQPKHFSRFSKEGVDMEVEVKKAKETIKRAITKKD